MGQVASSQFTIQQLESILENGKKIDYDDSIDCSMDITRTDKYLSLLSNTERCLAELVIKHTKYVTMVTLLEKLEKCINDFFGAINVDFYLLVDDTKIGSEHFLITRFWDRIKTNKYYKGLITSTHFQHYDTSIKHFLFIDDAVFSATHILNHFDTTTYDIGKHENKSQTEITTGLHFHMAVSFATQFGVDQVKQFCKNFNIHLHDYHVENIQTMAECTSKAIATKLEEVFDTDTGYAEVSICPFYFQHKVPNEFGSYPHIYLHGTIPGKPKFGLLLKNSPNDSFKQQMLHASATKLAK